VTTTAETAVHTTGLEDAVAALAAEQLCPTVLSVVMGMRRRSIIVLRWPGLGRYNVAGSFTALKVASEAVRRVATLPAAVSTLVLTTPHASGDFVPVVGVHAEDADTRAEATRLLCRFGARAVHTFNAD
jgi:hypothetical protein